MICEPAISTLLLHTYNDLKENGNTAPMVYHRGWRDEQVDPMRERSAPGGRVALQGPQQKEIEAAIGSPHMHWEEDRFR